MLGDESLWVLLNSSKTLFTVHAVEADEYHGHHVQRSAWKVEGVVTITCHMSLSVMQYGYS